jgi:hypothetical protein
MASAFGCNPQAAAQLSQDLAQIRADLAADSGRDAWHGSTGSTRVDRALGDFFADSSDSRAAMGSLLDRASGLMRGLSEGTLAVDQSLAGSLETAVPAGPVAPAERAIPLETGSGW